MTYFDPNVYDPEKLVGSDRDLMDGYEMAVSDVVDFLTSVNPAIIGMPASMRTVYEDVQRDITDRLVEYVRCTKVELTCSLMESNLELYGEE